MNSVKVSGKRTPFDSWFIVFLILFFSGIAIFDKNQMFKEYNLPFWVTYILVVILFISFISFGFPLKKDKTGNIEILNNLDSSFLLGIYVLPLIIMNSSEYFIIPKGIVNTIMLIISIIIWTAQIYNWKTEDEWKEVNKFGDFISIVWLVSGFVISIGLYYYDFAIYPISLLTSINSYLDLRLIVSAIFTIYIISCTLKDAFDEEIPFVEHIKTPKINLSKSINEEWISSIVIPFTIVSNILFKIIFTIFDTIWITVAYNSIIIWRICSSLVIKLYSIFFKRSFVEKLAFCLVIVLFLFSSEILTDFSHQIVTYINTDLELWDFHLLKPMILNVLFLLGITLLSLASMKFVYKEIGSFQFQMQVKLTYIFLMLTIFCNAGWFLKLLKYVQIMQGLEIPNIGQITIPMTLFISIVLIVYVINQGIKKAYNK